jgi:hypothetical protein
MSPAGREAEIFAWAKRLYEEGVDRKDAAVFANAFVEDGWLRFGNNEPITSREAIREGIAQFFTLFAGLSHESAGTTYRDGVLVLEANVTYTLHKGGTVTVPACTIFRLSNPNSGEPKAKKCNIYVDLAPLFGALQNPGS